MRKRRMKPLYFRRAVEGAPPAAPRGVRLGLLEIDSPEARYLLYTTLPLYNGVDDESREISRQG